MRGASVIGGKGDKRGNPGVQKGRREKKFDTHSSLKILKFCDFFCLATNDVYVRRLSGVFIVQVGESSARLHT